MKTDSFLYTNSGGRAYNEDSIGKKLTENGGVFVLADGLGGHLHGELASKCAVDCLLEAEPDLETETEEEWLIGQLEHANEKILALQAEKSGTMKTTAVVLRVSEDSACWAHVGDSRLYYLHHDEIMSITEDHSVAYKKYKSGEITRAQIGQDPDQSSLLRALGNSERHQADVSRTSEPLQPGDGFLLCSDGVWEYVYDNEVLVDFLKAETAREWAELLLLRLVERIPPDNDNLSLITVLIR